MAVEQSTEPTRNIACASKNITLIENSLYSLPKMNWNAQEQSRNAEEYQPTSATVWKWLVILRRQE